MKLNESKGSPPMAQTSEMALVAAIAPKISGSSTRGVMTSVVKTKARSSSKRYTAASSAPAKLVRMRSSFGNGSASIRSRNSVGLSLAAHPDEATSLVRRISLLMAGNIALTGLGFHGLIESLMVTLGWR